MVPDQSGPASHPDTAEAVYNQPWLLTSPVLLPTHMPPKLTTLDPNNEDATPYNSAGEAIYAKVGAWVRFHLINNVPIPSPAEMAAVKDMETK